MGVKSFAGLYLRSEYWAGVALWVPEPLAYYGGIVMAELLLFVSTGPINSVIVNVVAPVKPAASQLKVPA